MVPARVRREKKRALVCMMDRGLSSRLEDTDVKIE